MDTSFIFFSECDEHHPCQGLGEHAHFRSFGMAFLTLFRIATGILYDYNHFQFITKERKRWKTKYHIKIPIFLHLTSFFFLVLAPIITLLRRQLERDNEGYIKRGMWGRRWLFTELLRFSLFCTLVFCGVRADGPICLGKCRSRCLNEAPWRIP